MDVSVERLCRSATAKLAGFAETREVRFALGLGSCLTDHRGIVPPHELRVVPVLARLALLLVSGLGVGRDPSSTALASVLPKRLLPDKLASGNPLSNSPWERGVVFDPKSVH